jgi:hypothetical protein
VTGSFRMVQILVSDRMSFNWPDYEVSKPSISFEIGTPSLNAGVNG